MPGGQPSITQPIAGPWDSPKLVTVKRVPKVLPLIVARIITQAMGYGCRPAPLIGGCGLRLWRILRSASAGHGGAQGQLQRKAAALATVALECNASPQQARDQGIDNVQPQARATLKQKKNEKR